MAPAPSEARHERGLRYIPALDGMRAFAVAGVMAFHGGLPFLPAGFLGVDLFFVLSGYLITTLLLGEWGRRATIGLRRFWSRRARRLLPALLLVVVFVCLYGAFVVPSGTYPDLRADAFSTLFYVANWHFIEVGSNYFVQTGPVSLLTHTWSLAIEEQFYLVWPLLVLVVLKLTRRPVVLLVICVGGALGSALEMALLYGRGADLTRLYYGTDTHAQSLLVGAALAVALTMVAERQRRQETGSGVRDTSTVNWQWRTLSLRTRRLLDVLGAFGAGATAILWWRLSYTASFLWRGGFLVTSLAVAAILVAVVCAQGSLLGRALAVAPLRFLGRISYGMYLWHFPLFQWMDGARVGLTGYPLFAVRCAATVVVATVSYYALERPIRSGEFLRRWRAWVATPVAVGAVVAVIVATTAASGALVAGGKPTGPAPRGRRTTSAVSLPLTPASPAAAARGRSATILLVGDSTAVTLGFGLSVDAHHYGATVVDGGIIECGVVPVEEEQTLGGDDHPGTNCRPDTAPSGQWPGLWATWIDKYHPTVVAILFGRWEVSNVEWRGKWTDILSSAFARAVEDQLQRAVRVASSKGAHVALMTAPCYSSGEQPDGAPWPADSPARLAAYNRIVRSVVASNPKRASVVNLNGAVCPGGHFASTLDDVVVRAPDGVHFPWFSFGDPGDADPDTFAAVTKFGHWIGPRLWPEILAGRPVTG
ncbi:MAG: acyltransferase family protein [Acidimicrobiales bacterium]